MAKGNFIISRSANLQLTSSPRTELNSEKTSRGNLLPPFCELCNRRSRRRTRYKALFLVSLCHSGKMLLLVDIYTSTLLAKQDHPYEAVSGSVCEAFGYIPRTGESIKVVLEREVVEEEHEYTEDGETKQHKDRKDKGTR